MERPQQATGHQLSSPGDNLSDGESISLLIQPSLLLDIAQTLLDVVITHLRIDSVSPSGFRLKVSYPGYGKR